MKKLTYLLMCFLLMNNVYAGDAYYLSYVNHSQNISSQGNAGGNTINVIANIGDTVSLFAMECDPCNSIRSGPWFFDVDTIPNSYLVDSLYVIITQAGTYTVMGDLFLAQYQFYVCLPPTSSPTTPGNILCICSSQGQACPGDVITYFIINQVPCATSYTWTPPMGASILANSGTSITLNFLTSSTVDTLRLTANNSFGSSGESKLKIECPSSVGIESIQAITALTLFPIPFLDKLNITFKNNELSEIILYDITSRKILQQKFTNSITLNTEQLIKGIYIYEMKSKNGVVKKGKVVKE